MTRGIEKFSADELQEALVKRRREQRQGRLDRLKDQGRVVDVLEPPPAQVDRLNDRETGRGSSRPEGMGQNRPVGRWRLIANRALLFVEVAALIGILAVIAGLVNSVRELNADAAAMAAQAPAGLEIAAAIQPTLEPVIDLIVLPGGHRPPVAGRPIVYEEAGFIPDHFLPLIDAYVPPAVPTPSVEQPRQVEIPAIEVNAPVVQGHEPEQLKKGVGQSIGSGMPGEAGNMVLSAHNDIYGEIFRHLDKLKPGDEVIVSTGRQSYTYVINEIFTVDPTEVEVMAPTDYASLTLISCYPYLINNKRIIVKADLVDQPVNRDG